MKKFAPAAALFSLLICAAQPLLAIDPIAVELGPAQSPDGTSFYRSQLQLQMAADGSFLLAWLSGPPTDPLPAKGRRFAADGSPLTPVFPIGTYLNALSSAPDGSFVMATSEPNAGSPPYPLKVRFFDAAGVEGTPVVLSAPGTAETVEHDSQGNFVVVYKKNSFELWAVRFDALGIQQGSEFAVSAALEFGAGSADVVFAADGGFTIFFEEGSGEVPPKLFRRRFDAAGVALEAPVAVPPHQSQRWARGSAATDGRVAVVSSNDVTHVIDGQYFDAGGNLGSGFKLSSSVGERGLGAMVAFLPGGDLLGTSNVDIGNTWYRGYLNRIGPGGQTLGPRLPIDQPAGNYDAFVPLLASHGDLQVVAWGDSLGRIFFQRFETTLFADGFESGNLSGWN